MTRLVMLLFTSGCLNWSGLPLLYEGDGGVPGSQVDLAGTDIILPTTDGSLSNTFVQVPSGTTANLWGIWAADAMNLFAVGDSGTLLASVNGGATWDSKSIATVSLRGIWGSSLNDIYVVGLAGTILHSTDAGSIWQPQSGGNGNIFSIWGLSASDIYVAEGAGTVLHGPNWTPHAAATSVSAVWGTWTGNLYAVGTSGAIYHSTDGGSNWTAQTSGTTQWLFSIFGTTATDVYAAGDNGTLLHSVDGASWELVAVLTGARLRAIVQADSGLYVVGDGIVLKKGGSDWLEQKVTIPANHPLYAATSAGGKLWICGFGGVLVKEI